MIWSAVLSAAVCDMMPSCAFLRDGIDKFSMLQHPSRTKQIQVDRNRHNTKFVREVLFVAKSS